MRCLGVQWLAVFIALSVDIGVNIFDGENIRLYHEKGREN